MKTITFFISTILIAISFSAFTTDKSSSSVDNTVNDQKIEIYYFHNTVRCATCNAVEDVTNATLKEYYPEQFGSDQIVFTSFDLEAEKNEALIKKYKVAGPTLLFISADDVQNLTNKGFMYARSKPEKFEKEIKKTIDKFLGLD